MPTDTARRPPVVFVHGLWLHAESWSHWLELFRARGYAASAASWPGDADTTEATRRHAAAVANHGLQQIADHLAAQISGLPEKPVLIGHSFGGLLVQKLLGRGLARAAIAIDPAPLKGVPELPLSALKAALPVLRNPFNLRRAVALTEEQFRFAFANAVPESEARELHAKYAMPGPARPLFQAATALLNCKSATRVHVKREGRGPLLLIAGEKDNTVPPVLVRSALKRYQKASAQAELRELAGRGHSLTIDSGWREVAELCLGWMESKGL